MAIFSEQDRLATHRYKADESYMVGQGLSPVGAYLEYENIIASAKKNGVDAIHPGYGFLSENAGFARRCEEENITFIGPRAVGGGRGVHASCRPWYLEKAPPPRCISKFEIF